jgi:replication factor C subunit 2/4
MDSLFGYESLWKRLEYTLASPTHICIAGPPGCGKTTFINQFLAKYYSQHNIDISKDRAEWIYFLKGDQDRGIHKIRESLLDFVRQPSKAQGIHRWVVVDDMDTFPELSQQSLRRPMEIYSQVTCFIFIGNHLSSLIPPIQSRCKCLAIDQISLDEYAPLLLEKYQVPVHTLSPKVISWFAASAYGNIAEFVHHAKLVASIFKYEANATPLTDDACMNLCSVPPHYDYLPFLKAFFREDQIDALEQVTRLWFRGFSFEDILESTQLTMSFFGVPSMLQGALITRWLIRGWAAYCQGNTSYHSICVTIIEAFDAHRTFTRMNV